MELSPMHAGEGGSDQFNEGGGAGESAGPGEILANFGRGWRGADRSEDGPEGTHRPKR